MIISKFNKYVEKHGRVTYIVLGIIICFMFVIFVTPESSSSGCAFRAPVVATVCGKHLRQAEFLRLMRDVEASMLVRTGMQLSSAGERQLRQAAIARYIMLHAAEEEGVARGITEKDIEAKIRQYPLFHGKDGVFDLDAFVRFKELYLGRMGITAGDFDRIVKEDIAVERLSEKLTGSVQISEAEVDAEGASLKIQTAQLNPVIADAVSVSEEEIKAFFADPAKLALVNTDALRTVQMARFPLAKMRQLPGIEEKCRITEAEVEEYYKTHAKDLYQGKTLDDNLRNQIREGLVGSRLRGAVRGFLNRFAKELPASLNAEDFRTAMAKQGGVVQELANVASDATELPGMTGKHTAVFAALQRLEKVGDMSPVVLDGADFVILQLTGLKAAELPAALDARWQKKIEEYLVQQRAVAWYQENVLPYAARTPGTRNVWDLGVAEAQAVENQAGLSEIQKMEQVSRISERIESVIAPFYSSERRGFTVAFFAASPYEKQVQITEEQLKAAYEARKESYADRKEGGSYEQVKEELKKEMTASGAAVLAKNAAAKLSREMNELWMESNQSIGAKSVFFQEKAAAHPCTVKVYPLHAQVGSPLADYQIVREIFGMKADKPYSEALEGSAGAYVICLNQIELPYLRTAEQYPELTVQVYRNEMEKAAKLSVVHEEIQRVQTALKEGKSLADAAAPLKFQADETAVTSSGIFSHKGLSKLKNAYLAWQILSEVPEKELALVPMDCEDGAYLLVYVESRSVEQDAEKRNATREALLAQKKQQVVNAFWQKKWAEADIRLNYQEDER